MKTQPQHFEFQFQTNTIRVVADENGNPWFCAKDVCEVLGYANPNETIKYHCRPEGVANCYPLQTKGGVQYPTFIDEGNLYRLMIKSNKPEAKPFEAKVCDEILPAIRKTGAYIRPGLAKDPFGELPAAKDPFDKVNANALREYNKMSPAIGQSYLVQCGITPDFIKTTLESVGLTVSPLALSVQQQIESAARFAEAFANDWQAQAIAAPFTPCLGIQALKLFNYWLKRNLIQHNFNHETLLDGLFRLPGYRQSIDYSNRNEKARQKLKLKMLIMPSANLERGDYGFAEWQAGCISDMDAALVRLGVG